MSLKKGILNPLDALGIRKLNFIPDHFTTIDLDLLVLDIKNIEYWICYNLNSRYAIKQSLTLDHSKKIAQVYRIGLEDPKEMTLLTLGCALIYKK